MHILALDTGFTLGWHSTELDKQVVVCAGHRESTQQHVAMMYPKAPIGGSVSQESPMGAISSRGCEHQVGSIKG